jgi:hypothetical protein
MYFLIQKVINIPSFEKRNENFNRNDFEEELSLYFRQLKFYMKKKNINYFCNSGPVYYKCYIIGCNRAYRNKRDLTVHIRKHVIKYKLFVVLPEAL